MTAAENKQDGFTARIAGHTFGIGPIPVAMRRRFAPFFCACDAPEFQVDISPEEIALRKAQGIRFPYTHLIESQITRLLLTRDVLHVHASALRYRGRAYLFSAPSGTGKSTHARMWRETFGEEVVMINDDKPFLRFEDGAIVACGSPWNGKHDLGANIEAPLGGVCVMAQGREDRIRRLSLDEAFFYLVRQVYIWDDLQDTRRIMRLLDRLVRETPVYLLSCTATHAAAVLARDILTGGPA